MILGPPIIRQCHKCKEVFGERTIIPGNTFGARYWTDGKREAPMLTDRLWLVKCPHCSALVWMNEQKQAETCDKWGVRKAVANPYANLLYPGEPDFADYVAFLARGWPDDKKEYYVRLRTWWAGNDPRRSGGPEIPMSEEETSNLNYFLTLFDHRTGNDRLMKAEILRELGRFDEAEKLLVKPFEPNLQQAANYIRELISNRCSYVAELLPQEGDE